MAQVTPGSPAARLGIKPGDVVSAVDGHELRDELDFRFYTAQDAFTLTARGRDGLERTVAADLSGGGSLGIEFEEPLFDGLRLCANHCSFCFVRQMPPGFRRSLYVRDDDYRLSFLHGSFVTLTNLEPSDWDRLAEQRLSPLFISVHATDPAVRTRLIGSKEDPPIPTKLRWLRDHRIAFHSQLVLVPGINDGSQLDRSLADLMSLGEALLSVSVVPVGLTRCAPAGRRRFSAVEADAVIRQVRAWRRRFRAELGRRTVYASDEWFLLRGTEIPGERYYEGFPQVENGVGMVRLLLDAWDRECRSLSLSPDRVSTSPRLVVCGKLIAPIWEGLAEEMNHLGGNVTVFPVENATLGPSVTVSGLLCGRDVVSALGRVDPDTIVCLPRTMFNAEGDLTLDGMTAAEISGAIGVPVLVGAEAADVLAALPPGGVKDGGK